MVVFRNVEAEACAKRNDRISDLTQKGLRVCMPSPPDPSFHTDPHALGVYMATMTASMSRIARQNGFEVLAYLLEIAHLEAETIRRQQQATGTDD